MKTVENTQRIKIEYTTKVTIPKKYKSIFWDCEKKTFLEKYILRILTYGNFKDIKDIYKKYPEETLNIAFKYPEIKRGIKFWIRLWKEQNR